MKQPYKAPPTLEEARKRLHDQYLEVLQANRLGKQQEWNLISKVELLSSPFSECLNPLNDHMIDLRPNLLRELAEWLVQVIRTKNSGHKLEHLATCLKAKPAPKDRADSDDIKFLRSLSWFLRDPSEIETKKTKGTVPTLAQLRCKLGWKGEQCHQRISRAAKRLGWRDLPHGESGKPHQPSPGKKNLKR